MANSNSKPTCQNCSYFVPESHAGLCQRYPQYITKHHNNWCGEYKQSATAFEPVPAVHIHIEPQEPTHAVTIAHPNVELDKLFEKPVEALNEITIKPKGRKK